VAEVCRERAYETIGSSNSFVGNEGGMTSERQVALDAQLERDEAKLLEPVGPALGERLVREIGKSGTAPEIERIPEDRDGSGRVTDADEPLPFRNQTLESRRVDIPVVDANQVPGHARDDSVRPQRLPQRVRVYLEGSLCRGREALTPDGVDQPLGGNDLVRMQQELGEHGARAGRLAK
jgi:hypothetical protein